MVSRIDQDHQRFRGIVKGRIRKDLRKFLQRGEMIGQEGGRYVSIPIHDIDIPTFRYGDNSAGVGSGEGEAGDGVPQDGQGDNQGGTEQGQHIMEVDVSLDELADILGEELELPRIEPKGKHRITTVKDRYTGIRRVGPNTLRHFKRTYREALRRQIALGIYDPDDPIIVPIRRDMRYRSWNEVKAPQSNAVIVYMMDVSGSMGSDQKEIVRLEAFWIDAWLRRNYEGIESRYIVHDVSAAEVDRDTFFHLREDGGTRISSAYKLCSELLDQNYDPNDWNIYLFHFSDGDNSSEMDNRECVEVLKSRLLEAANLFGYCQVASAYGSGNFINVLHEHFDGEEGDDRLITSRVNTREDILDSIKTFFSPGK
ncbi:MAG: DUF444 family protein [Phycisphaerales bacterium]|nr:DUF444 family protein [Phycisphaerales bacterium]